MISGCLLAFPLIFLGDLKAYALRQPFNRFAEIEPFVIHHKAQRIAAGPTAKAVIELALGVNRKRGCSLVVKRTAGGIVFARFFQFYAAIYDLNNIESVQ